MFQHLICAALASVQPAAPATSGQAELQLEQPVSAEVPEQQLQAATSITLPALTVVELKVIDELTSKTATAGMPVKLSLAKPLYLTDVLGVPAGTPVEGVVIHAAKGGMGGKSGELLIGAKRIILSDALAIPLRSFKLGPAKGQNNETLAFATAVAVGLPALLINGGSARVPAGAVANAKTQSDAQIPVSLLSKLPPLQPDIVPAAPAAKAPDPQPVSSQGETK